MNLLVRKIVGWSMASRITDDSVLDALTMSYWRRKPGDQVILHSGHGSQYDSGRCKRLLKTLNIEPSRSRRENCHDTAVAESFLGTSRRRKSDVQSSARVTTQDMRSSPTLRGSIIRGVGTRTIIVCLRQCWRSAIFRIRKVSNKLRPHQCGQAPTY